jgi:hypothetical protein
VSEFENIKNEAEQLAQQHPEQAHEAEQYAEQKFGVGQKGQGGQQDQYGQGGQQDQYGQGGQGGQQDQYGGDQPSGY